MEQKKLRELEEMCIQEHAPTCTAACPIHVDARAMIAEIRRGDFAAALKFLKKTLPFPGIIGRICDQPCRVVCKRNEVGESIAIAALERACADLAATSAEKPMILPRRGKRVAILGGGLSGLTVAFDLGRKGYGVTIFEAEGHLGGGLWEISDDKLPRPVILKDIAVVEYIGVEVRLNTPVGQAISLARVRDEFDAVYLGIGANPGDTFGLRLDGHGQIEVDPVTLATGQDGVFAGGSLLRSKEKRSPIQSIGDGRRAATSIDRYLQKVS
jgi:NADPH-dependent glutamate synthase beta subunit-like oxidoreductase